MRHSGGHYINSGDVVEKTEPDEAGECAYFKTRFVQILLELCKLIGIIMTARTRTMVLLVMSSRWMETPSGIRLVRTLMHRQ